MCLWRRPNKLLLYRATEDYQRVIWQNDTIGQSAVVSFNRRVFDTQGRVSVSGTDNSFDLVIKNISIWDEGRYNCHVTGQPAITQMNWIFVNSRFCLHTLTLGLHCMWPIQLMLWERSWDFKSHAPLRAPLHTPVDQLSAPVSSMPPSAGGLATCWPSTAGS